MGQSNVYTKDGRTPEEILNELGNDKNILVVTQLVDADTHEVLMVSEAKMTIEKFYHFQETTPDSVYEELNSILEDD